jgi:carnitine 3-dehydrogenase
MRCGLVGAGVIGGGWAARFVLNGHDVMVHDPHPEAERRLRQMLDNAARAYDRLTLAPRPAPGELRFAASIAEAVEGADLVQESAPEREDLKQGLLREIDTHAPEQALISSSTSGLLPTRLQAKMRHPERFLVAHPFNPVYLLPLVELCGGEATSSSAIEKAREVYTSIGMMPLVLRKEIDGFIADRLLEALWREALWLVHDGVATTGEIDDAVRYGAGMRWAFMGTFLTYRLAGGEDGMRHFMAQFGPALKLPWTKLMDVPELSENFIDEIARQSDDQAAGLSLRELERKRDDCLVAIMQALRAQGFASGNALAAYEDRLYALAHRGREAETAPDISQPLRLFRGRVLPEWIDYNGHMTESRYLQVFGDASDALTAHLGVDAAYHDTEGSYHTGETHICHVGAAAVHEPFEVSTQILAADEKRIHLVHSFLRSDTQALLATAEQMLLHVGSKEGRVRAARADVVERIRAIAVAQAKLPRPEQAGRQIGKRHDAPAEEKRALAEIATMLDPEVAAFIAKTESFYPASSNTAGPAENRATYDHMCAAFRMPYPAGIVARDEVLRASSPERELKLRHYELAGVQASTVLLYLHGGGFVLGGLDSHDDVCAELCAATGVAVAALDYRLSPEHRYPAALDDSEAAFEHLLASGRKVIVGGDSAGGNLTAAICLRRRRRAAAMPAAQMLIYPGLGGDARRNAPSRNAFAPLLRASDSGAYRRLYSEDFERLGATDPEFAPLRAPDFIGLPPAAIFAAGIDPLRQDAEDYAARLGAAGVPTLFRVEPGLVHGYLRARHMSRAAERSFAEMASSLRASAQGSLG